MRTTTRDEIARQVEAHLSRFRDWNHLLAAAEREVVARLPAMVEGIASATVREHALAAATDAMAEARRRAEVTSSAWIRETVRRHSREAVPRAAAEAVAAALPDRRDLEAQVARIVSSVVDAAVDTATTAAASHLVERSTRHVVTSAGEALADAQRRALETIDRAIELRLAELVAEMVPPVVQIVLPTGQHVALGADAHRMLSQVLTAVHAGIPVLLVGPAGTGKSMLAKQVADARLLPFEALSVGPTTPMSKVFGFRDAHGAYHDTPFRRAFENGGVMLLDELDNGHPGLLAELNQALSLGICAFADGMVSAHPDFRIVATANTYGSGADRQYVGRQALDAATLDRFVVIDVPVDDELEQRIALRHAPQHRDEVMRLVERVRGLRALAEEKQLPVMFSPRASIDGAKLLAAGATIEQVVCWRIVRGLSAAHRTALGLDGARA